jgi:hypothetical protein
MRFLTPMIAAALLAGGVAANAQEFRVYTHPETGTSARVPADWRSEPLQPADEHPGTLSRSPDGDALLAIYSTRVASSEMAHVADEAAAPDERVTYRANGRSWFVRSGFKDGNRIFYRKAIFACGGRVAHLLAFEYPAAEKRSHDRLVTATANSLRAERGAC